MKGKQKRVTTSVRIEPRNKELIERAYGSVQKYFDLKLEADLAAHKEAEVETKDEEISEDDF